MKGLGRIGYAGRTRRTGPHPSMGFGSRFRPGTGLGAGVGVIFLLVVVSLFSHFPVFLVAWVIVFAMLPILGTLARSIALLLERRASAAPAALEGRKEKELLRALALHGEIDPTRAALETSLSVSEADRMLSELTKNGYLQVRARDGGLVYALWEHGRRGELPD